MLGWAYYVFGQLVTLAATIAGWFVLPLFCVAHAWRDNPKPSINDGRLIDEWSFAPLNWIWGNPEDGVSGQDALVWINGDTRVPYWPMTLPAWAAEQPRLARVIRWGQDALRAFVWSGWRNSADALKYVFRWRWASPAPFKQGSIKLFGRTFPYTFGWKIENGHFMVPIISFK